MADNRQKRVAVTEGVSKKTYTPPPGALKPNAKQHEYLMRAISTNILFSNLEADICTHVVAVMHAEEIAAGKEIITQGENGDLFYVVEKGSFDIIVGGRKVAVFGEKKCFGELALMYNAPRAATVKASVKSKVWVLHRQIFRDTVRKETAQSYSKYSDFLTKVPLLKGLSSAERNKVAGTMDECLYKAGDIIFEQGSEGNTMYILVKGQVSISKDGEEVMVCGVGDFFGERALLKKETRAATPKATTDVTLLEIDKNTFDSLLGPLEATLSQAVQSYDVRQTTNKFAEVEKKDNYIPIPFSDLEIIGTLGNGSFGHVRLVRNAKNQDQTFALKGVSKAQIVETGQQGHIMSEKNVMAQLNHPFLIRLFQTYKDKHRLYFLLEPVLGGELFTLLKYHNVFDDSQARFYASCVVLAFEYMHSFDIVYRDLKPENLLIDSDGYIKITDFGFAKKIESGRTWTLCGTPDYLAPEIVAGKGHGKGVDWWTLGILVYEMLCSAPPFYDKDQLVTYQKIMGGDITYPPHFSSSAISLIKKLLYRKAARRLGVVKGGASLIKKHKWFREYYTQNAEGVDGWTQLYRRQIEAPQKPTIASKIDLSNFEDIGEDDDEMTNIPYVDDGTNWEQDF